ncbi:hypothetical protein Q7P35_010402 [Cladosporium inversicolor]
MSSVWCDLPSRSVCAAAAAAVDMVLCVSTARSSSRHPTGAVARVDWRDWLMDARARGHQHNNNGVCACVRVTAYPARLSDVDARLPQDAGGTWRDLTIGSGVRREGGIVPYGKVHIVDRYILLRLIETLATTARLILHHHEHASPSSSSSSRTSRPAAQLLRQRQCLLHLVSLANDIQLAPSLTIRPPSKGPRRFSWSTETAPSCAGNAPRPVLAARVFLEAMLIPPSSPSLLPFVTTPGHRVSPQSTRLI